VCKEGTIGQAEVRDNRFHIIEKISAEEKTTEELHRLCDYLLNKYSEALYAAVFRNHTYEYSKMKDKGVEIDKTAFDLVDTD
jgi:hypothetical protein